MDEQIRAWRTGERTRLLEVRRGLGSAERARITAALTHNLSRALDAFPCTALGIYWPIKSEFDIREWATALAESRSIQLALPVVVRKNEPLEYWRWRSGDALARGFWNIMVPAERTVLQPDVVVAPLVGFANAYRLGYGGGYFDRTLAAARPRPRAIGLGLEASRLDGYVAQPYDIPMDVIVTEAAVHRPADG